MSQNDIHSVLSFLYFFWRGMERCVLYKLSDRLHDITIHQFWAISLQCMRKVYLVGLIVGDHTILIDCSYNQNSGNAKVYHYLFFL